VKRRGKMGGRKGEKKMKKQSNRARDKRRRRRRRRRKEIVPLWWQRWPLDRESSSWECVPQQRKPCYLLRHPSL
jgi:hypothetical protein